MKYAYFSIFILTFLSCQPKDLPTQLMASKEESYVKVSHMTTINELKKAQQDLKLVGITLDFNKSSFFENGLLRTLNLVVVLPNGTGGSCAADLTKMQFNYHGFEYKANGNPILKTGTLSL